MITPIDVTHAPWTRALGPLGLSVAVAVTVGTVVGYLSLDETDAVALAVLAVLVGALALDGRKRLVLGLSLACYVLAFHWAYTDWIVPVYRYTGMIQSGADASTLL